MKITSQFIIDSFNDFSYIFKFTFENDGLKSQINIFELYLSNINEWNFMYESVRDDKECKLDFYQGNDYGRMTCNGKEVIFSTIPLCARSDIFVSIIISLEKYKQEFLEALENLLNHEIVIKHRKVNKYLELNK